MMIINTIIRNYLAKHVSSETKKLRSMSNSDLVVFFNIRECIKSLDSVTGELTAVQAIINAFSSIDRNLDRDASSASNLLTYAKLIKNAFCVVDPTQDELIAINEFITNSEKRAQYFLDTVIPEVVDDSALEKYMRLYNVSSIMTDMVDFYGSKSAVESAAANGYQDYIDSIKNAFSAPSIDSYIYPGYCADDDLPGFLTPALDVGSFFRGNSVCFA